MTRMQRNKKRTKFVHGCPKCGGSVGQVSGFMQCLKCHHTIGTQHPEGDAPRYYRPYANRPEQDYGRIDLPVDLRMKRYLGHD